MKRKRGGPRSGLRSRALLKKMAKKAKVDKAKCIGCGTCSVIAEKSFKLGDDGKAEAINPAGDSEAKVKEAIESCPVQAISLGE